METVSYLTINDETKEIADISSRSDIENIAAIIAAQSENIQILQNETGPSGLFSTSIEEIRTIAEAARTGAVVATQAAIDADEKATSANQAAERAWNYADTSSVAASNALSRANAATEAAAIADEKAVSATTASNVAWSQADTATLSAAIALNRAGEATSAAQTAAQKADAATIAAESAEGSARSANSYANQALSGLSTLESVVDVVNWFTEHKTPSTDEEVNSEKNYYIYDSETGAMSKVEPDGLENPRVEGWYELDETIKNYVISHVAQTDDGLYVLSTNGGWRILISTGGSNYIPGIFIIDPAGTIKQRMTGDGISFDETAPFHIGDQNAYILFEPPGRNSHNNDNNGHIKIVAANGGSIDISGQVNIGGNGKTLDEALDDLDAAIIAVEYGVGSSRTSHIDIIDWSSDTPEWQPGKYIWMRTSNGTSYTYTCIQGAQGERGETGPQGERGEQGDEGIGILSIEVSYAITDSEEIIPEDEDWRSTLNQWYSVIEDEYGETGETGYREYGETGYYYYGETGETGEYEYGETGETGDEADIDDMLASLPQGSWLWVRTETTYTDFTSSVTYQKSYIGTDGKDGTSVFIESASRDENTKQTTIVLTDGEGNRTELKINDGQDGSEGQPGADGKNIHIAWADNITILDHDSDPETPPLVNATGFSTYESTNKKYLGVYSDTNILDSENPGDYSWSLIKGADGTSVEIQSIRYAKTSSDEQPSTFSYTTVPTVNKGEWLWVQTIYSDGKVVITKSYIGLDGQDGNSVSVQSISKVNGITTVTLVDSANRTTELTIRDGQDGPQGIQGAAGADGSPSYTHFAWATNVEIDDSVNPPDIRVSGFDKENSLNKPYMGVYSDSIAADSNNPLDYSWTLVKGEQGEDGKILNILPGIYAIAELPSLSTVEDGDAYLVNDGVDTQYDLYYKGTNATNWTIVPDWQGIQGPQGPQGPQGIQGNAGYNTATILLYQRAANQPDVPSSNLTYTFSSHSITESLGSWSTSIPNENGNPCWVIAATATANTNTDTITTDEWTVPTKLAKNGIDGLNQATIFLYQRAATQPNKPTNLMTYEFATGNLSSIPIGWHKDIPASDGNPCWVISAAAIANTATDAISSTDWSTPTKLVADGLAGANGYNTARLLIYQRAASQPAVPANDVTYSFASNTITAGSLGTWSLSIPSGTDPCWASAATATSDTASDVITSSEWTTPVTAFQDGAAGASGINQATIFLYQRAASQPSKPANDLTYQFSDGELTGSLGSWSRSIPTVNSNPCWVTTAAAISSGTTDTIAASEWSTPTKLAQDGARGPQGYSVSNIINYYLATSASSGVTTSTSGWSTDPTTQTMTSTNKYLWNYEVTKNNNNETITTTPPIIIGVYGEDGTPGAAGKGVVSITEYYARNNSTTAPGDNDFSTTVVSPDSTHKYLWNYEVIAYTTGNPTTTAKHIIGVYGDKGDKGDTGNGIASVTTTYGVSNSGSTQPSSWSPSIPTNITKGQWLWIKTETAYTGSPSDIVYNKSYIGTDGEDGTSVYISSVSRDESNRKTTVVLTDGTTETPIEITDGADGAAGQAGLNGYIHTAWANSADGTSGFSTTISTNKTYLGVYTDNIPADSNSPSDYSWSLIKGERGDKGDKGDSITVTSSVTEYVSSTSGTTAPSSGWQSTVPTVAQGSYLWTKVTTTFSDSSEAISYTASRQGMNGTNGTNGTSVTVSNTEYAYQLSTSGTTPPTGTWQSTPQAPTTTQYAWTRTVTTYSDNSTATTYTVGGKTGTNGANAYTYIRYGTDSSGAGMTATPTSSTTYIGIYSGTSSTAPTAASSYTWSKYVGNKGDKGDKGDQGDTGPEAVVTIAPTTINWEAGTATLGVTLRVNGEIVTPTSYVWTEGTSTTPLGVNSTLAISGNNALNKTYNCTVTW